MFVCETKYIDKRDLCVSTRTYIDSYVASIYRSAVVYLTRESEKSETHAVFYPAGCGRINRCHPSSF